MSYIFFLRCCRSFSRPKTSQLRKVLYDTTTTKVIIDFCSLYNIYILYFHNTFVHTTFHSVVNFNRIICSLRVNYSTIFILFHKKDIFLLNKIKIKKYIINKKVQLQQKYKILLTKPGRKSAIKIINCDIKKKETRNKKEEGRDPKC